MADTHDLHKGEPLRSGRRRVLQLEYAASLFGNKRPLLHPRTFAKGEHEALLTRFPRMFARFVGTAAHGPESA